jgi:hypothetical protein
MRNISPKEYAKIKGYSSVSTVYKQMRDGLVPWVEERMTVKRIPWDDIKKEVVKSI